MKSQCQGVRHSLGLDQQLRNLGNNFQGKGKEPPLPESRAQPELLRTSSAPGPFPAQQARPGILNIQALCSPPQPSQSPGPRLGWCEASRVRLFSRAFSTGKELFHM